jgi:hypothetical protein
VNVFLVGVKLALAPLAEYLVLAEAMTRAAERIRSGKDGFSLSRRVVSGTQ